MGQHPQRYIHNVAMSVMREAKINIADYGNPYESEYDLPSFPHDLWNSYGSGKVMSIISRRGPSARGRIAACGVGLGSTATGVTRHWDVNRGEMLNEAYKGDELLTLLATYVVIAAIVDIFRAEVRKEREEEREAYPPEWMDDHALRETVIDIGKGG